MRQVFMAMFAGLAVTVLSAAQALAGTVEVKGPHICCMQCVNVVGTILGKVDGVTDVKADVTTKTVTFTAKDDTAAKAGVKALIDGGFFGKPPRATARNSRSMSRPPEKGCQGRRGDGERCARVLRRLPKGGQQPFQRRQGQLHGQRSAKERPHRRDRRNHG